MRRFDRVEVGRLRVRRRPIRGGGIGTRLGSIALLALLALPGASCAGSDGSSEALERGAARGFNLLVITLDTTRPDYVSGFGGEPEITPHLAELAQRSWTFSNAYSETNITNPSHLTIFSGLRALDHGVLSNDRVVPEGVETLAEVFQRMGYATAGFPSAPHIGPQMGWRGFGVLPEPPPPAVDAPELVSVASRWVQAQRGAPFFAWVHFFDPHALYEPPAEIAERFYDGDPEAGDGPPLSTHPYFEAMGVLGDVFVRWLGDTRDLAYGRAMYAAELHYADRSIETLLRALEAAGVRKETVVVVLADHGESLDEHEIFYDHKGLYEQQLRIPLLVHVPGMKAGSSEAFVTTLDVVPTIEELFDLELQAEAQGFSGRSLLPYLRGRDGPPVPDFFVHQNARNHVLAVREGYWKLHIPLNPDHPVLGREVELFDLSQDPDELTNLAASEVERVRSMRASAQPWLDLGLQLNDESGLDAEAREQLERLGYE